MTNKPHATIWIAKFTSASDDDGTDDMNWDQRQSHKASKMKANILEKYPKILQESQHGDVLEDSRVAGYRSDGVFMISRKTVVATAAAAAAAAAAAPPKKTESSEEQKPSAAKRPKQDNGNDNDKNGNDKNEESKQEAEAEEASLSFEIVPLDFSVEDHGSVPVEYLALTEFPLDYWEYSSMTVVALKEEDGSVDPTKTQAASYWHTEGALVQLGDIREHAASNVQATQDQAGIKFQYQGKEYTIRYVTSLDQLYSEFHGMVYVQGPTSATVEL